MGVSRASEPLHPLSLLLALLGLTLLAQGLWIPAKAQLAQFLLDRAFTRTLAENHPIRPWPWADTWPIARLTIPRLAETAIVLAGGSGQALAFGPTQLTDTPIAGEPGTAVFAAHRDTHFRFLSQLIPGDAIDVLRQDGALIRFRVTGTAVVRWDASGIDPRAAGRNLVLATCWPFDALRAGPLRFIVRAERIEPN